MMDEFPKTWEVVSTDNQYETKRMRVPGGWLVNIRDVSNNTTNVKFVADPSSHWTLET